MGKRWTHAATIAIIHMCAGSALAQTPPLLPAESGAEGPEHSQDATLATSATPATPADGALAPATSDANSLPMPPELAPQVDFWTRVYTEIDSNHAFLHDSHHLDVVYETVALPRHGSRRAIRAWTRAQTHRISTLLTAVAHSDRQHLTSAQQAVLVKWPTDVTNATLLTAAANVRMQSGQSEKFKAGVLRARTWMPHIAKTLADYGLPRELAALPHVESSFDLHAYSKAHAAGIWQFTPATARLYMHMDATVDERYDPIRATEAAARLLNQNYKRIGTWPLAITAYNHGTEGVRRAMHTMHTTELTTLIEHYHSRHFGFASRNFYAELLAAWRVASHAQHYFGDIDEREVPHYATVRTDAFLRARTVASALGVDLATLKAHNPALRPIVWAHGALIPRGFTLRVPVTGEQAVDDATLMARLSQIPSHERFDSPSMGAVVMASAMTTLTSTPAALVRTASKTASHRVSKRGAHAYPVARQVWDPSAPAAPATLPQWALPAAATFAQ